jgi:hypothetical protein
MAIITKPALTKGVPATIAINKNDLAAVAKVAASPRFSQQANWKNISIGYLSTTSNQDKTILFNAQVPSPSFELKSSAAVDDNFKLLFITIHDFDNGTLTLNRADLGLTSAINAAFDMYLSPLFNYMNYNQTDTVGGIALNAQGGGSLNSGFSWVGMADSSKGTSGNISVSYEFDSNTVSHGSAFGLDEFIGGAQYSMQIISGQIKANLDGFGSPLVNILNGMNKVTITRIGNDLTFLLNGTQIYAGPVPGANVGKVIKPGFTLAGEPSTLIKSYLNAL